jgi:hypothetical protein
MMATRQLIDMASPSPRSLLFPRDRDSVRLLLGFQPNQQPVNDLLDTREV